MSQQITEVDTAAAAEAVKVLQRAYAEREQAKKNLANVRRLGGQSGYKITIDGVAITVADTDYQTYMAKLVRGREMIHLGALKALEAIVDGWEEQVAACEQRLAALTGGKGGAA